jgi:hypothetical protein
MFQHPYPEVTDLGGVPAGQTVPIEALLHRLRLTQLLDLARAYELKVNYNGVRSKILPIIQAEADAGTFRHPPKHPHYLHRAYFSSDDVKKAKGQLGDPESSIGTMDPRLIPAQIKPWLGQPVDEPKGRDTHVSRETIPEPERNITPEKAKRGAEFAALKERAKELGIRIQGKTPQGLKAAVTHHEKRLAAQEAEDVLSDEAVVEQEETAA